MNLNEFVDCLDRYGSNPERWPGPLAESGRKLLADSDEAMLLLDETRRLDDMLNALPMLPAAPNLQRRIVDELAVESRQRGFPWFGLSLWRPVLAGAFSLALGVLIGISQPTESQYQADSALLEDLALLAFSAEFEELPYVE